MKNVMMHDGSWVKFRKLAKDFDPTDRDAAYAHIREHERKGEVITGLLYISPDSKDVLATSFFVLTVRISVGAGDVPLRGFCAAPSRGLLPFLRSLTSVPLATR